MNVEHQYVDKICIVIVTCPCVVINLHYKTDWIYPYNGPHPLMCSRGYHSLVCGIGLMKG